MQTVSVAAVERTLMKVHIANVTDLVYVELKTFGRMRFYCWDHSLEFEKLLKCPDWHLMVVRKT